MISVAMGGKRGQLPPTGSGLHSEIRANPMRSVKHSGAWGGLSDECENESHLCGFLKIQLQT